MRLFAITVAGLLGIGFALTAAPVPKEKTAAEKLVGTWKLTASSQPAPDDVTFLVTFGEKGEMTLKLEPKDKDADPVTLKGKYKFIEGNKDKKEEDKIDYEMDDGTGGKKQEVLKIKKITDDDLVTTDPDDIKEEFSHVKEKKKDEEKKPEKK